MLIVLLQVAHLKLSSAALLSALLEDDSDPASKNMAKELVCAVIDVLEILDL